jgi:tetratricopeptide (TPR) repeat protein
MPSPRSFLSKFLYVQAIAVLFFSFQGRGVCSLDNSNTLTPQESRINENALRGIHLLYNLKFEDAETEFQRVIVDSSDKPIGYFYMAMATWSHLAVGFWGPDNVKEYKKRIDKTIKVARRRIDSGHADSFDYFYLGGALGFKGRFELMERKWFSAFLLASDAIDALNICLEMDPENKDVMLGLGIFDYYTAKFSGVLKFLAYLLLHRGNMAEGIRKLTVAANEAVYSATEAKNTLLHIYLFLEEDYVNALPLTKDLASRYKDNPRFEFFKGIIYMRQGRETEYKNILQKIRASSQQESLYETSLFWEKRSLYLEAANQIFHGSHAEARDTLMKILAQPDPINDPGMIAWPLLKLGMSYDLEGNREKARQYYQQIMSMKNGSGAQFLAEKFHGEPPKEGDPFIGY